VLALIGGTDRGLRMGGRCRSSSTSKTGTLLGVLKEGSTISKVLWDDSDGIVRFVSHIQYLYFFHFLDYLG